MINLTDLAEQAKEMAKIHGAKWDNSLSKYPDGTVQFEVVSSKGETIVTTGRDKNTDSWLCDYLILCSPENIVAIAKYVAELEQRLNATAQPVSDGWVKCSERMPDNGETVQFYLADDKAIKQGRFIIGSWYQEQDWCESAYGGMIDSEVCGDITHWMPLPAAPGGQD